MKRSFLVFVAVFSSCFAHAEFGTLDDVVEATLNHEVGSYIHPLTDSVYRHLCHFVKENNIHTPRQKTALLRAVSSMYGLAERDALQIASDVAAAVADAHGQNPGSAFREAHKFGIRAPLGAAKRALDRMARDACQYVCKPPKRKAELTNDVRYEDMRAHAKQRAKELALESSWNEGQGRQADFSAVSYGVAEWVILNEFVEHIVWLLPDIYADEILWVSEDMGTLHPFFSESNFDRFVRRHVNSMDAKYMLFINPIMAVLDSSKQGFASAFQFMQGINQDQSVVSALPMEMVQHILSKL